MERELVELDARLIKEPSNVEILHRIADIYLLTSRLTRALVYVNRLFKLFKDEKLTASQGVLIADVALKYWKQDKYASRNSIRINISLDRRKILESISVVLNKIHSWKEPGSLGQSIALKTAYVRESLGQYTECLSILSELITTQAMETGVDLTYIIMRAAVVLKHVGANPQSIEYLEFLADDPPIAEGYGKTHILALLTLLYEQSGDQYSIITQQTYETLFTAYSTDLSTGKRPITNQKKIEKLNQNKAFSSSCEVWEMLALQAVDRCDYIIANELFQQAICKAPNKGKLLHFLAESYYLLGEPRLCCRYAERAFALQPNSSELRDLLLIVNPEKWQDRIRSVSVTKEQVVDTDNCKPRSDTKKDKAEAGEGDSSWLAKIKSVASDTLKTVQDEGAVGLLSALGSSMTSFTKTAEQQAQEAVDKERRRKEKLLRKGAKAAAALAASGGSPAAGKKTNFIKRKVRDLEVDGPAKPEKPMHSAEASALIHMIREGNTNIHLYDPNLIALAAIRDAVERDEREVQDKKNRQKAAASGVLRSSVIPNSISAIAASSAPKSIKK